MDINKTKTKIKDTYLQMINEHPNQRIKVIELCKLTQINRSTFYAYYYDIYQVMEEINEEIKSEMIAILQREVTEAKDLKHTFTKILELVKLNRNFFLYYLINNKFGSNINILDEPLIKTEIENLRSNSGVETIDFEYNYAFFNGGMAAIMKRWIVRKCDDPIDEIVAILIKKVQM